MFPRLSDIPDIPFDYDVCVERFKKCGDFVPYRGGYKRLTRSNVLRQEYGEFLKAAYLENKVSLFFPDHKLDAAIDCFSIQNRYRASKGNQISIADAYASRRLVSKLNLMFFGLDRDQRRDPRVLHECLYRVYQPLEVSRWKLSVMAPMIRKAKMTARSDALVTVFDPCAGWGDRVLGSILSEDVGRIVGLDANSNNCNFYEKLIDLAQSRGKECEIKIGTVESSDFPESVDLVVVSPPYYNYEHYSDTVPTYASEEEFKRVFLTCLIEKTYQCLRPMGIFGIYVSDVRCDSTTTTNYVEHVLLTCLAVGFKLDSVILVSGMSGRRNSMFLYYK